MHLMHWHHSKTTTVSSLKENKLSHIHGFWGKKQKLYSYSQYLRPARTESPLLQVAPSNLLRRIACSDNFLKPTLTTRCCSNGLKEQPYQK